MYNWAFVPLLFLISTSEAQEKIPDVVKKAEAVLVQKPDDPDANATLGKYHLEKGDVEKALPFLTKGKDDAFRVLADHEAKELKTGPELVGMGDEWAALLKKYPKGRLALLDRASSWWAKGFPLCDNVWKEKLRSNLQRIYAGPSPAGKAFTPGEWKPDQASLSGERVHSGAFAAKIVPYKDGKLRLQLTATLILPPGTKAIDASAWVLTDTTDSATDGMQVHVTDAAGKILEAPTIPIDPDVPVWRQYAKTIACPPDAKRVSVIFTSSSTKGLMFVDDVSLQADGRELLQNGAFEK